MRVAHDMPRALKKIKMGEISGDIQSRIFRICGKIIVFEGMFIPQLAQCVGH